jgi:hypothetical protein
MSRRLPQLQWRAELCDAGFKATLRAHRGLAELAPPFRANPIRCCRKICMLRKSTLLFALLGTDLYETLRQEDETSHLDPFRHDVAYHLTPFTFGVHS